MPLSAREASPETLVSIRSDLLRQGYAICTALGALLILGNFARYLDTGWKPLYGIYALAYAVVVVMGRNLHRLPRSISVGFLLALLVAASTAGLLDWGIVGNSVPAYLGSCLLAAVMLGTLGGFGVLAACVAVFAAVGYATHAGWHEYGFDPGDYLAAPSSWLAAIATFAATGGIVTAQVSLLRGRLVERIRAERNTRQALAAEIDERRRSEQALRTSRERFQLAFETNPRSLMLSEWEGGRILEVNPSFEHLTGLTRAGLVGRSELELGMWPDANVPGALRGAKAGLGLRTRMRAVFGSQKDVACTAVRIVLEGRAVLLTNVRDVSPQQGTARKLGEMRGELERRVLARTRQLEGVKGELERFVSAVSQDFAGPLHAIQADELLLRGATGTGALTGAARADLDRVRGAVRDAGGLIDGLVALTRINRQEVRRESVDLSALADQALAQLRKAEPGRDVEAAIEHGVVVLADRSLMRLVLANLLDNAWKFTARTPRPRIEFGARRVGSGMAYFVRDNGAGFDMVYAAKLFHPFERLHPPREFEGTGIGLATVARALQHQDGRVWAEANTGLGATFWFTFDPSPVEPPSLVRRKDPP
ncbi:MAG: PAS domain S-box protein [Betaproteobacteria bacterium]|nr:PAS domain S-box protein [Betaproteobacteria bacterium]